jgi:hypothetical protein
VPEPPPECVALNVIVGDPELYPWYPGFADYCGTWYGQPYYRERPHPPPPPPPPPPPHEEPPPECVAISEIIHHQFDYPWYPNATQFCGTFNGEQYFREYHGTGNGGGNGGNGEGRGGQPPGDVDEDEAPHAYLPEDQDDLTPFDPE